MRTTIHLDDALLREAKRAAADSGKTLTALIEESVRERLARRNRGRYVRKRIKLVTDGSGGVGRDVNLDDTADLLDLMDEADDPLRR
jgi:putative antitoxin of VapBC-like toxin-antitoxin system